MIRIGVPDDLPPFGAPSADGELEGYDIDVANLLAKDLGVRAELVPLKSGNRVASLLAHRVDLLVANLGVNPERAKSIAFSTPYAPFFSGVFGAPGVVAASPAELQGKRVAVTRDSLEDKELSAVAQGAEILRFDDNKATMDAYLAGQADLVATGNVVVADLVKRQPGKPIERKFVIRKSPASIGVPRGQPHLLNWVNVFVFHKKLTGELDALAQQVVRRAAAAAAESSRREEGRSMQAQVRTSTDHRGASSMTSAPRDLLRAMFDAAVAAALPERGSCPAHLPPPPQGPHHRARRRQGLGRHGAGGRGPLARAAEGPGRHPLRPRRALRADRDRRGGASGARRRRPSRGAGRILELAPGRRAGRPRAVPDLGRRLGAAGAAGAGPDPRGQAGGQHARCSPRAPTSAR